MTDENKTYATKATAKRGAERSGIKDAIIEMNAEGRWTVSVPTPIPTVVETVEQVEENTFRVKSEVKNPVKLVWDLCFENKHAPRKDIVAKAIELGVATNTARTQYQYWRKAEGLVRSPKHA